MGFDLFITRVSHSDFVGSADDQDGYDLSGKKIVLFATSGGGGIGKTAEKLMAYLSEDAKIVDAKVFKRTATADELREWVGRLA